MQRLAQLYRRVVVEANPLMNPVYGVYHHSKSESVGIKVVSPVAVWHDVAVVNVSVPAEVAPGESFLIHVELQCITGNNWLCETDEFAAYITASPYRVEILDHNGVVVATAKVAGDVNDVPDVYLIGGIWYVRTKPRDITVVAPATPGSYVWTIRFVGDD